MTTEEVIQTVDKFQLIKGYPPAAPGKCVGCGKFSGEFIDFGFDIDYYGAVYFCRSCFTEGCHLFGYHSDEKMRALAKDYSDIVSKNLSLTVENEELKNALAASGVITRFIDATKPSDVPTVEDVQPKRAEPTSSDKPGSRREKGSAKQSNESGSASVPNDDSSLEDVIGNI